MAEMIPVSVSELTNSSAEKKLFDLFKRDEKLKNSVVFHSVGVEKCLKRSFAEIDFIVCVPGGGVFALEVKGGRVSRREDGVWIYTDREGIGHEKVYSPYNQASHGLDSLFENYLKNTPVENVLRGYGIMFPDVVFNNTDPDITQEIIFDFRDGEKVGDYIFRLSGYYKSKIGYTSKVFVPTATDIDTIKKIIRKPFDWSIPLPRKLDEVNSRLVKLTEQQYMCAVGLRMNRQCIVFGGGGTGKSLLAIQRAKELMNEGKRIGFFCFNLLLAGALRSNFSELPVTSVVASFTDWMEKKVIAGQKITKSEIALLPNKNDFYRTKLPEIAADFFKEQEFEKFDALIIDEAQDLASQDFLFVMDEIVKGGLAEGEVSFYGDFQYQRLFAPTAPDKFCEDLAAFGCRPVKYELTINCRNAPAIQNEMNKLFGLNLKCKNSDFDDCPNVKHIKYIDDADGKEKLENIIKDMMINGIEKSRIAVLSVHRYIHSIASLVKKYCIFDTSDYAEMKKRSGEIIFSTVWRFKGLEKDVIILVDIDKDTPIDALYSGMSRAKALLYILKRD